MADYYSLLSRAIANLPKPSPASARRAIYDRARKALVAQLRSLKPQLPESDIAREENALEAAVARLESEFESSQPGPQTTARAASTPAPVSPLARPAPPLSAAVTARPAPPPSPAPPRPLTPPSRPPTPSVTPPPLTPPRRSAVIAGAAPFGAQADAGRAAAPTATPAPAPRASRPTTPRRRRPTMRLA